MIFSVRRAPMVENATDENSISQKDNTGVGTSLFHHSINFLTDEG